MTAIDKNHWDNVYATKAVAAVSWFQAVPTPSLEALDGIGLPFDRSLIDVGGGASTLVDALLDRGWSDLSVLDISTAALEESRRRLGNRAQEVGWIAADLLAWQPRRRYDVWHDRAVFHFLTSAADRGAYRQALQDALAPHGTVVVATFAPDGPEQCSGLAVQRYDADQLASEFGQGFVMLRHWSEHHVTPSGNRQSFTWVVLQIL
jgi:trans-aconitate methyltransferase